MSVKVYLGHKMTGRDRIELIKEARSNKAIFEAYGCSVFDPVLEEGIEELLGEHMLPEETLRPIWFLDKKAIRKSDVLIDCSADEKSFGLEHEIGYSRYFLWHPLIRISPRHAAGFISVSNFEDDIIVGSVEEAARIVQEKWGSWWKRFCWRVPIILKGIPKFCWYQLASFF